jgi:hypothetical protein
LSQSERILVAPRLPDLHDAPNELLLTRRDVAALLRTTVDRLEHMEAKGEGPPYVRLGPRSPRYQLGTFRRWLQLENIHAIEGLTRDYDRVVATNTTTMEKTA